MYTNDLRDGQNVDRLFARLQTDLQGQPNKARQIMLNRDAATMTDKVEKTSKAAGSAVKQPTRRQALKTLGLGAGAAAALPLWARYAQAQTSEPIRIGFGKHATGIGAAYGRWYDRTSQAAIAKINAEGGMNGRMLELVTEDDGTDPRRAAEVLEKFASQSNCDVAFGTLLGVAIFAINMYCVRRERLAL